MKVTELKPKSNKLKDIREYIAECSSVVRDKQPKSAEKLFSRLLTESIGDTASRVLEYIPCTISGFKNSENIVDFLRPQMFGFFDEFNKYYYTNARELLNWGWSMRDVVYTIDFTNYQVFKCEAPYFIYGQVSTHNQLTTVSHSQRFADCEHGYWKPPEVKMSQEDWDKVVGVRARPQELVKVMKDAGITRKEVWDRGRDMLQNRVFTIGGYTNNPNAWSHFLKQRLDKHTQIETQEFAKLLDSELKI